LWDGLVNYLKENNINMDINQTLFNSILNLYPEFLRPNILSTLTYLKKKKNKNNCSKIMIYTNNQGSKEWVELIKNYFEDLLQFKLFDQIIAAFKINGKTLEICRSSHYKSHRDLIKCTKIPMNTEICFIDDSFHPHMKNDNVYYINIKPYIYDLKLNEMLKRLKESDIIPLSININYDDLELFIENYMIDFDFTYLPKQSIDLEIDNKISRKILKHLHIFFKITKNITKKYVKNNNKYHSKTLKVKYF